MWCMHVYLHTCVNLLTVTCLWPGTVNECTTIVHMIVMSCVCTLTVVRDRFKDFTSLKGCHWVYNDNLSLSGNLLVLAELRKRGYNACFFGSCNRSGSWMSFHEHMTTLCGYNASFFGSCSRSGSWMSFHEHMTTLCGQGARFFGSCNRSGSWMSFHEHVMTLFFIFYACIWDKVVVHRTLKDCKGRQQM